MKTLIEFFTKTRLEEYKKLNKIMIKSKFLYNKTYPLNELLNKIES